MSNQQLIKSAHIWVVIVLASFGIVALSGKAVIRFNNQNSNQNSNANANANMSQNRNANKSSNRNSGNNNAAGTQAGMGTLNSHDHDFIMDAAMGGLMEVELGRVAAQRHE